jgi:Tol biopolymer transport system component
VLLGLALLGLAGAALGLVYRGGWQRLRDPVAQEVAYEDAQSLDRNVAAVQALHVWATEAWGKRRLAEAAAGLAATLPAENLLPLAEPPRLEDLRLVEPYVYEANVLRRYADSAGQVYTFALTQRYRSTGPGFWARLPPLEPNPAETTTWAGRRISVTYPLADQPWMAAALPRIDAYLSDACADWGCPAALRLPVAFTGQIGELPRLSVVERPAGAAAAGGYPIIFDLAFRTPRYPRRVLFPSPQLAGRPYDEAASQALVRALTSQLLGQIAADLTVGNRSQYNVFLDALVARAEVRLGLSRLPPPALAVQDYIPVTEIWREIVGNRGSYRPPRLAPRLQAAWFLDAVMGDRLASADGSLLLHLRWARSLPNWLEGSLQIDGVSEVERWEAEAQAQLAAASPPDWDQLSGLAYACADGLWLVRAGLPERLPLDPRHAHLNSQALSPDGRYLAVYLAEPGAPQLHLLDLSDFSLRFVAPGHAQPLGWTATGQLAFFNDMLFNATGSLANGVGLYDPAAEAILALSEALVPLPTHLQTLWSAQHDWLSFNRLDPRVSGLASARTIVVAFSADPEIQPVAAPGFSLALSPDGRWLAHVTSGGPAGRAPVRLQLLELSTQVSYDLLAPAGLDAASVLASLWSPDGVRLAALVLRRSGQRELILFRLDPAGPPASIEPIPGASPSAFPVGFSADGRYLAFFDQRASDAERALLALDLETGTTQMLLSGATSAAWSPSGRLMAIAGPGKLFVTDPATGRHQWIAGGDCSPVWYAMP